MKKTVDSVTKDEIEKTVEKLTPKNRQHSTNIKNTELVSNKVLI